MQSLFTACYNSFMTDFQPPDFPNTQNFWVQVPQKERQKEAASLITREFCPLNPEAFGTNLEKILEHGADEVVVKPDTFPKGAEVFELSEKDGKTVALGISKYYSWNILRNQMAFKAIVSPEGDIQSLRLEKFSDIVDQSLHPDREYSLAIELAYNLVDPEYRGKKLGSKVFDISLARINYISADGPKLVFTMAKGDHVEDGLGKKIFDYALEKERTTNGVSEDGKAIIKGIDIPVKEIVEYLHLPEDFKFNGVHPDSVATVHLANKVGMKEVGLFKDLTPIHATQLN